MTATNRFGVDFTSKKFGHVARPVVRVCPLGRQGAIDESVDLNPFRLIGASTAATVHSPQWWVINSIHEEEIHFI